MPVKTTMPPVFDIAAAPGHLIRRAHQLAVAQFGRSCAAFDLTAVQFGALTAIAQQSGIAQSSLANYLALDAVTVGSVLQRLEVKRLIERTVDRHDKRKKSLTITASAETLLAVITPHASAAQSHILSPLLHDEQIQLIALLNKLIAGLETMPDANKTSQ